MRAKLAASAPEPGYGTPLTAMDSICQPWTVPDTGTPDNDFCLGLLTLTRCAPESVNLRQRHQEALAFGVCFARTSD